MKRKLTASAAIRTVLGKELELPAAEAVKKIRALGVEGDEKKLVNQVHNIRSIMRKSADNPPTPEPAKIIGVENAVAHTAVNGQVVGNGKVTEPAAVKTGNGFAPDLSDYVANTERVAKLAGMLGGTKEVRSFFELVRQTGGTEAFLQHLELVEKLTGK